MIKNVLINNFKIFKESVDIPLSSINLFTGINGKGKSTALQVFLLLSQSALRNRATNKIILNGENVRLGRFDDVKNRETLFSERIYFAFIYESFSIGYFLYNEQSDASELLIEKVISKGQLDQGDFEFTLSRDGDSFKLSKQQSIGEDHSFSSPMFDLFLSEATLNQYYENFDCEFVQKNINLIYIHYVSADRMGPRNYYENKSLDYFESVGALGENTINILYHKGANKVHNKMLQGYCNLFKEDKEELSETVEENVNYWIGKIFQGAKIQVESIKEEDLLKLRINSDGGASYFKPTNVGYGFSYSLPIIVAGLTAKPGEILIIENPEAHLHPYAQSIISKFLSLVSSTDVQILIESHSEHILNGLRVAVKSGLIEPEHLNVLYFNGVEGDYFKKINVDENGGINDWPIDFFDQSTIDLNYLLGI